MSWWSCGRPSWRTEAEAEEFLKARLGLGLPGDDVAALVRRTEGWPTGLHLAVLSASHARDPRRFIQMFGASSRHVVDFFIDEVLRRQPADLQAFMTRCSILGRLSGDLCDALLQREGSRETLESLFRANLARGCEQRDSMEQQRLAKEAFACLVEHGLADAPGTTGDAHTAVGIALATQGHLDLSEALAEAGDTSIVTELLSAVLARGNGATFQRNAYRNGQHLPHVTSTATAATARQPDMRMATVCRWRRAFGHLLPSAGQGPGLAFPALARHRRCQQS